MEHKLAFTVQTVFGLAFDVEKTSETQSGFKPADFDFGSGKDLFGELRLEGFAALLRLGFAEHLVIVGGDEARYGTKVINRAWAIRQMLMSDHKIAPERITCIASHSNTSGNIGAISNAMEARSHSGSYAVVSSHYHLPRVYMDLLAADLHLPVYAAEAFSMLEQGKGADLLVEKLGGGALAERISVEIQGIADKLQGRYKPRTDAASVCIPSKTKCT